MFAAVREIIQKKLFQTHKPQTNGEDKEHYNKVYERQRLIILVVCHISAFIRSLAISLQHTVFPFYAKSLGVNPQVFGYLGSCTAILQLIGGPICGHLSDVYGGRAVLIASFLALGSNYVLVLLAQNIPMLFLTRLPLFGSHVTQSIYIILTDITSDNERADMFGKIGVSIGLGMIFGSLAAGYISEKFSMRWTFVIATVIVLTGASIVLTLVPKDTKIIPDNRDKNEIVKRESRHDSGVDENASKSKHDGDNVICGNKISNNTSKFRLTNIFKNMYTILKTKHFLYLIILSSIATLPYAIKSSMFSIIVMEYYHLGPKYNGILLSYGSIVSIITQGYLVGLLIPYYTDATLIMLSIILVSIGSLFLIIAQSVYLFCIVIVPLTIGGSIFHIIIMSLITKIVEPNQIGAVLGITSSVDAIIRIVSPTTGGFLFQHFGFVAFGSLSYIINSSLTVYLTLYGRTEFV